MKTSKKKALTTKKKAKPPKSGLSGFMVVWRHTMDDVPLGLYADEKDAIRVAKKTSFKAAYKIAQCLGIDCGSPVCFGYVSFVGGVAKELTVVDRKDDA